MFSLIKKNKERIRYKTTKLANLVIINVDSFISEISRNVIEIDVELKDTNGETFLRSNPTSPLLPVVFEIKANRLRIFPKSSHPWSFSRALISPIVLKHIEQVPSVEEPPVLPWKNFYLDFTTTPLTAPCKYACYFPDGTLAQLRENGQLYIGNWLIASDLPVFPIFHHDGSIIRIQGEWQYYGGNIIMTNSPILSGLPDIQVTNGNILYQGQVMSEVKEMVTVYHGDEYYPVVFDGTVVYLLVAGTKRILNNLHNFENTGLSQSRNGLKIHNTFYYKIPFQLNWTEEEKIPNIAIHENIAYNISTHKTGLKNTEWNSNISFKLTKIEKPFVFPLNSLSYKENGELVLLGRQTHQELRIPWSPGVVSEVWRETETHYVHETGYSHSKVSSRIQMETLIHQGINRVTIVDKYGNVYEIAPENVFSLGVFYVVFFRMTDFQIHYINTLTGDNYTDSNSITDYLENTDFQLVREFIIQQKSNGLLFSNSGMYEDLIILNNVVHYYVPSFQPLPVRV